MHQDLIQKFLNQPEVVGIALMQGRIVPYFHVKEKDISPDHKNELIRRFRKDILDIPTLSNCLEFQVDSYFAYTYKLNDTLKLLVVALKRSIAVESIAKNISISNLENDLSSIINIFKNLTQTTYQPNKFEDTSTDKISTNRTHFHDNSLTEDYTIEELIITLNELSQIVCNYLGPKITSNFWQLTRPKPDWLSNFNIKSNANIEFIGSKRDSISPLQHLLIREWTNQFINQCSHIIRDLPSRIDQIFLNQKQRKMISIMPKGYLNEVKNLSHKNSALFD